MLSELEAGADITATDRDGRTLLHWAASCNKRTGVIALLLDHGADVNARTIYDETPLMVGILSDNDPTVMGLLLDYGADIEAREHGGGTPLIRAGWGENSAVIALLLDRGADVAAKDDYDYTVLHTALDWHGLGIIEKLLESGADILARNHAGTTPLHVAVSSDIDPRVVELLLDRGAEICQGQFRKDAIASGGAFQREGCGKAVVGQRCRRERTRRSRHDASALGGRFQRRAVFEFLLDHGADIHARDYGGNTVLHFAIASNPAPEVVELLLDRGADVDARNISGQTPCQLAKVRHAITPRGYPSHRATKGSSQCLLTRLPTSGEDGCGGILGSGDCRAVV